MKVDQEFKHELIQCGRDVLSAPNGEVITGVGVAGLGIAALAVGVCMIVDGFHRSNNQGA